MFKIVFKNPELGCPQEEVVKAWGGMFFPTLPHTNAVLLIHVLTLLTMIV